MMKTITIEHTLNFTKDLDILYAEDDLELQLHTQEFFDILFRSVTVVNDGKEALEVYKKKEFDIVISDIKMPTMDGVSLVKNIKKLNPQQSIIIISAYNDPQYLLDFINLNIRQFITKPIKIDNILETLYDTSKMIVNEHMVQEYRTSLEESNKELTQKNKDLESLVRILDAKLLQNVNKNSEESIDEGEAVIESDIIEELKELETDIGGAAVLISLSRHLNVTNIQVLGKLFLSYADLLDRYSTYKSLQEKIKELGESLNSAPQTFIDRVQDLSILLESFIYVLRLWRGKVEEKEFNNARELHVSMITDIVTIISIINGTEDDIHSDMEFF